MSETLPDTSPWTSTPMLSSKSFTVLVLKFSSIIHFEWIILECMRQGSNCLFACSYPVISAFELWCWRRLLKGDQPVHPKGDQSWLLEGLTLKLKLQYFGHLMWRADSLDPDAGKDWRREEKRTTEDEMVGWHHRLDGHQLDGHGGLAAAHGVAKSRTRLSNWTELIQLSQHHFVKKTIHSPLNYLSDSC